MKHSNNNETVNTLCKTRDKVWFRAFDRGIID